MAPALKGATLHFCMYNRFSLRVLFAESFTRFLENRDF